MKRTRMRRPKRNRSLSPAPAPPPAPPASPPLRLQSPLFNAASLISPPISFPSQLPAPPSPPTSPSPPYPSLSAAPCASSLLPPPPPPPSPLDSPAHVGLGGLTDPFPDWRGRFHVIDRLGYGSFASVWLAHDSHHPPPHPHNVVALKRIRPLSSAQRIYDEARFLEQLDGQHHCCKLLEILIDKDDPRCHPTLVLSYMPHSSYKTYLPELTLAHIQQYMRALLEALAHLAAQPTPILHRDLKPANFLVQWPPSEESVERWLRDRTDVSGGFRLVDFGLAHAQHKHADRERAKARELQNKRRRHNPDTTPHPTSTSPATTSPTPTAAQSLPELKKSSTLGTRGFRAPEILLRHPRQQLCCASDVWNAGVIFLSLLTQRYPIFDRSDSEEALVQLMTLLGTPTHIGDTNITLHNLNLQRSAEDANIFSGPLTAANADRMKDFQFPGLEEYCWLSTERHWPSEAFDLLRGLLTFDPHERLTAQQAIHHPFLSIDYDVQDETYAERVEIAERNEVQWMERKRQREERWRENERKRRVSLEKENQSLSSQSSTTSLYRRQNWMGSSPTSSALHSPLHQLYSRGRADISSRGATVGLLSGSGWNSRAELSLSAAQPYKRYPPVVATEPREDSASSSATFLPHYSNEAEATPKQWNPFQLVAEEESHHSSPKSSDRVEPAGNHSESSASSVAPSPKQPTSLARPPPPPLVESAADRVIASHLRDHPEFLTFPRRLYKPSTTDNPASLSPQLRPTESTLQPKTDVSTTATKGALSPPRRPCKPPIPASIAISPQSSNRVKPAGNVIDSSASSVEPSPKQPTSPTRPPPRSCFTSPDRLMPIITQLMRGNNPEWGKPTFPRRLYKPSTTAGIPCVK